MNDLKKLHQAIDQLSEDQLTKLANFVEHLQHAEDEEIEGEVQLRYSQSPQLLQLREGLMQKYGELVNEDRWFLAEEEFSWLEQIPLKSKGEFLLDLLLAVEQSQQNHDWSEVIRTVKSWKVIASGEPPFEPVYFPEGILKGYDFSPELINQARKEMWAGFGQTVL
jgi:hypothetical protein